jgi:phosphonoacetaldehyde hydrolase
MTGHVDAIRLVVFDWAGTTVDHGSCAPVAPFVSAFARQSVEVMPAEVRGPMGVHKKDHIRALLLLPDVADRWRAAHGRDWTEADVEDVYQSFIPLQMETLTAHAAPIEGVPSAVAELRQRGIKIGGTTGYFRAAADRLAPAARRLGYAPDISLCPDDVPAGRPAPWMIFRIMEASGIYPPAAVVKIGDTIPDIEEGRNAGVWSVGVTQTGSIVGCMAEEFVAMPAQERFDRVAAAARQLIAAGAHAVISSAAEAPALIDRLNDRLRRGERP